MEKSCIPLMVWDDGPLSGWRGPPQEAHLLLGLMIGREIRLTKAEESSLSCLSLEVLNIVRRTFGEM